MTGRVAIVVTMLACAATTPPAERVVTGDGVATVTIDGAAGRMRIDPAATAMPLIDTDWATRAGLKAGMFGFRFSVGPEHASGGTAVAQIDFGGGVAKRRIGFTGKRYAADVDGVAGPGSVPEPIVRFVLRPSLHGEQTVSFRMIDQGGLLGGWAERFAVIDVGGTPMRLRLDPHHPRTLATAGAGARLAAALGGQMTGAVSRAEIAFGIERPVRDMVLARPLMLGPLAITRLGVRTVDNGTTKGIADADVTAPAADPDEIVVTAKGKTRDLSHDRLALGADMLARCSSIVFDKPARAVRLTCA